MKYRIRMEYTHGSETAVLNGSADDICNITMSAHNGITKLTLNSKKEISIQSFRIILPYTFSKDCRILQTAFRAGRILANICLMKNGRPEQSG